MTSRKLKVWTADKILFEHLDRGSLDIDNPYNYGWDWKRLYTELHKSLRNGTAPDIIEIGTTWTARLAQEGLLLDITGLATEHLHVAQTFLPRQLSSCTDPIRIERYYALPLLADVQILFYNEDYLGPYLADHPHAFHSWNDFNDMCQALKETGPQRVVAWPLGAGAFHACLPWVWATGGDFLSSECHILHSSERTEKALRYLAHLILTDCAPLPPDHQLDTLDRLRAEFIAGNFGITTGALWATYAPGWHAKFKAVLHPPDLFPATFVGGSNLAIVRKYEGYETSNVYESAKECLVLMTKVDNQIRLAKAVGKLPANIEAWEQMKLQTQDENERAVLATFDRALHHTIERGMPNLLNYVEIEELLKVSITAMWEKVGWLKRDAPEAPLDALEPACHAIIHEHLREIQSEVQKYLTGYTVQYTHREVQEIGVIPPGQFDLWLDVTNDGSPPRGNVYITDQGLVPKGIGPTPFHLLVNLVNAPHRTLSQQQLVESVWNYKTALDHSHLSEIMSLERNLSSVVELLRKTLEFQPGRLLDELQFHSTSYPSSILIQRLKQSGHWGSRFDIHQCRSLLCDEIVVLAAKMRQLGDNSEYVRKIENLRVTYKNLSQTLGQIRGRPMIRSITQSNHQLYCLDKDLKICIVKG